MWIFAAASLIATGPTEHVAYGKSSRLGSSVRPAPSPAPDEPIAADCPAQTTSTTLGSRPEARAYDCAEPVGPAVLGLRTEPKWDNAAVENFFSTLKTERCHRTDYLSRDVAKTDVFDYIERFYYLRRRHSTMGYLSPANYERAAGMC